MPNVLHVGCGSSTIAQMPGDFRDGSWRELRFDIDPTYNPDFIGTMLDMNAVASDSVDALYSSHNIEHVFAHEVDVVLREFRRVIKPEGFVTITCPDLESVARHIADGRLEDPLYVSPSGPISALDIFYGHGAAIARGETYMAHRTGFTAKTLGEHARRAGFATFGVRARPKNFDLWMVATKIPVARDTLLDLFRRYTRS